LNNFSVYSLKVLRTIYAKFKYFKPLVKLDLIIDINKASEIIQMAITSDQPCMIARFGANELNCLINFLSIEEGNTSWIDYIKGNSFKWWWDEGIVHNLHIFAGFFPPKEPYLTRFAKLMIEDIPEVDILASWLTDEYLFEKELKQSSKIEFELLNPYFSKVPWTRALEGKKVLVIHPFAYTIQQQYKKRELLFKDNLLPAFELKTIKAVQSIAASPTQFPDWFAALNFMKAEIDRQDYDICLIGCGAYGFPLAAHVKRSGKKAVQLGGSLQLLFGIKGKRWEVAHYNPKYNYAALINENWVKPSEEEKPLGADTVEGACYW
jgi:hypothetical protein